MTLRLSKWQYEEQFRDWRVGKYITRDAWAIIFKAVDQLRIQGQKTRILINDKEDKPKTQRARRAYDKNNSTNLSQITAKGDPCQQMWFLASGPANLVI